MEGAIQLEGSLGTMVVAIRVEIEHFSLHFKLLFQESLLFSASLRVNLDPFNQFSDEKLWDVLEKVGHSTFRRAGEQRKR